MKEARSSSAGTVIEREAPPGRLDVAVSAMAGVSRSQAQRLIVLGRALVEGRPGRSSERLRGGERLRIEVPEVEEPYLAGEPLELRVAYEDESMLIVDKPAGLIVHPGAGHADGTLVNALVARAAERDEELARDTNAAGDWPGIVHRLDRDTSGLLMVAKTEAARRTLRRQLAERTLEKEYLALVRGEPEAQRGRIEAPVGRDPRNRQRMAVVAGGRESVTEYEVVASLGGYSLLAVRPRTGRTHQIRAHLAFLRLPIAGDVRYGGREGPGGLRRQFLHAAGLRFERPSDGVAVQAWSELPADLVASLAALPGEIHASIPPERLPVGLGATVGAA